MLTSSEGKSDPYVVFTLNNQKVFKSQTKKKTLTPEWNESFAVQVVSLLAETKLCFMDYYHLLMRIM